MITALYASLCTCLMIWLSIEVIKQRRTHKVAYDDGDIESLQIARSAQSNAVEYIPITLILMAFLEYNSGMSIWLHIIGVVFVCGRLMHARAILTNTFPGRKFGMLLTFSVMMVLIVLNFAYLPFEKLW
ncbi:MAPEG family protein [Vibrio lamellibrachiae]|uniref:MAPEG family protein n=1 Tax=Vibrio lamellibrachiae TaxID=2910253 RepID=UPI003D09EFBE